MPRAGVLRLARAAAAKPVPAPAATFTIADVKELVDMYEGQRDSQAQLRRFVDVLARQRAQLEARLADLRTTLDEVLAQEAAARRVLRTRYK